MRGQSDRRPASINLGALVSADSSYAPFRVRVTDVRFLSDFPDGPDKLWAAKVEAWRGDTEPELFETIMFAESSNIAFIYGIEFGDAYPQGFRDDLAQNQQSFIQFLRSENAATNAYVGPMCKLFSAHQYATILSVTRAYVFARNTKLDIGVGYWSDTGKYELVTFELDE